MDLDAYVGICPQFQSGKGGTHVDDANHPCNKDHPYILKWNFPCPYRVQVQRTDCPFGPTGCKYVHESIILPMEQQQITLHAAPQGSGVRAAAPLQMHVQGLLNQNTITNPDAQFFLLAGNGATMDSRDSDNICKRFANKKCNGSGNGSPRIHLQNGNRPASGPSNPQQNQPQGTGKTEEQLILCIHFAAGNCRAGNTCNNSHDPHDAPTGTNNTRTPNLKQPCTHERKGPCTRA
ncbi:uncharacterized protein M421DRAFT_424181, partial [Didymella exigua CBS 183.55]